MQLVRPTFTQGHVPQKDFLLVVCKYTSNKNLQKSSRPNSFTLKKAGDVVDTMFVHRPAAEKALNVSAIRAQFVTQMQKR